MSESQNLVTTYLTPIIIYIAGRLLEYTLKFLYDRWKGIIGFKQEIINDTGYLTIKPKKAVFVDEAIIHLPEKSIDILTEIKTSLDNKDNRIQLEPTDKIKIECVIQRGADKQINITALIGKKKITNTREIDTEFENPEEFMNHAEITIDTPNKRYNRKMFQKII